MDSVDSTPSDIHALRRAAQFLRRMELRLPDAAHQKAHEGALMSARWLDDRTDKAGTTQVPATQEARRPIFNHFRRSGSPDAAKVLRSPAILSTTARGLSRPLLPALAGLSTGPVPILPALGDRPPHRGGVSAIRQYVAHTAHPSQPRRRDDGYMEGER